MAKKSVKILNVATTEVKILNMATTDGKNLKYVYLGQ